MELRRRAQRTRTILILFLAALGLALAALALPVSGARHTATGVPSAAQHSTTLGKEPDTADLERQPALGPGASRDHDDGILQLQP